MNGLNRRMYALLLTITVAATNATYCMKTEMADGASEQQNEVVVATAWYRKRSTKQIMAAVVTGAAIVYTVAAYMNKVSSPIQLWRNLFMPALPSNTNVTNGNGSTGTNGGSSIDTTNSTTDVVTDATKQNKNDDNSYSVDNDNVSGDQGKKDDSKVNVDTTKTDNALQNTTDTDLSSTVTNEENKNIVVSADDKKNLVVLTENTPKSQMEKNVQTFATYFQGFRNTGTQKFYELKNIGTRTFHEFNDKWNNRNSIE